MHTMQRSTRVMPARRLTIAAMVVWSLLLAACGPAGDNKPQPAAKSAAVPAVEVPPKLAVVATFTILADMIANVGGDRVEITTLVGPDGDAHQFSPTPSDARALANAKLVVVNGLGFEGWLDKLNTASGFGGTVVVASEGIQTVRTAAQGHAHGHTHDHGEIDPHGWQSLVQAERYVSNIADALVKADPQHEALYRSRAAAYVSALQALDAEARKKFNAIAQAQRRVITDHDSFGYFGQAYGLKFYAPRAAGSGVEASAKGVARLVQQIRKEKIRAVFTENISDPRLIEQLARESGARVGGVLFSDALSVKDPRARTYLDMMRHNIDALARALAPDDATK